MSQNPSFVKEIKRRFRGSDLTPTQRVESLTSEEFSSARDCGSSFSKPFWAALVAREKREKREETAKQKWNDFAGWVHATVTKAPINGIWVHTLAKDGKELFGESYATKSRVERAARSYPDLTLRLQDYGEPGQQALAVFRGLRVETETLEERELL